METTKEDQDLITEYARRRMDDDYEEIIRQEYKYGETRLNEEATLAL